MKINLLDLCKNDCVDIKNNSGLLRDFQVKVVEKTCILRLRKTEALICGVVPPIGLDLEYFEMNVPIISRVSPHVDSVVPFIAIDPLRIVNVVVLFEDVVLRIVGDISSFFIASTWIFWKALTILTAAMYIDQGALRIVKAAPAFGIDTTYINRTALFFSMNMMRIIWIVLLFNILILCIVRVAPTINLGTVCNAAEAL